MSNKRYLEFDSTYRNRECYPCPADFKVQVTCAKGSSDGTNAKDYVAKEYPSNSWYQLPYAGSEVEKLLNTSSGAGYINCATACKLPYIINGDAFSSLWPVDWMSGTAAEYFSTYGGTVNIVSRPGTGISGTRFCITAGNLVTGLGLTGTNLNSILPAPAPPANTVLDWSDTVTRAMNIVSPDRFSGGTPSVPRLGPRATQQAPINDYFAGAKLLRFSRNPLLEPIQNAVTTGAAPGDGNQVPLLGSLGFPFYYQTINIEAAPPSLVLVGKAVQQTASGALGVIASVINSNQIVVRLSCGAAPLPSPPFPAAANIRDPILDGTYPGRLGLSTSAAPNGSAFLNGFPIFLAAAPPPYAATPLFPAGTLWGLPTSISQIQSSYFIDTFVESSVITKYNGTKGEVTLKTPFSTTGDNAFNPVTDYYLISFNTDPSNYWSTNNSTTGIANNVQDLSPRIFFPTGAPIPNYYSGRLLENVSLYNSSNSEFQSNEGIVASYDDSRRLLTLEAPMGLSVTDSFPIDSVSTFTVLFLAPGLVGGPYASGLPYPLPAGTIVSWNETNTWPPNPVTSHRMYRVAITAPIGSTSVVFEGSLKDAQSLLLLTGGAVCDYICPPPWYRNVIGPANPFPVVWTGGLSIYDFWSSDWTAAADPRGFLNPDVLSGAALNRGYLSLAGFFGASTIAVRGKTRLPMERSVIPYAPRLPEIFPNRRAPVMIRNGGVFELTLKNPGSGYVITDPTMPILALLAAPIPSTPGSTFTSPFTGMVPLPESVGNPASVPSEQIFTFLNICFVNVLAVDRGGGILRVSINSPGSGYPRGATVLLISGTGGDIQLQVAASPVGTWTVGAGTGATALITGLHQSIGFIGGASAIVPPNPGDSVYIPTYGWGFSAADKTLENSAPNLGAFVMNFSGTEAINESWGFVQRSSELPRTIQNCVGNTTTYPETGSRVILHSFRSINNQVLIDQNISAVPGPTQGPTVPVAGALGGTVCQYAAPGAYLGGIWSLSGNPRFNGSGQNSVLWVGLKEGFNSDNFTNEFQITNLDYVDSRFTWCYNGAPTIWLSAVPPGANPPAAPSGFRAPGLWADHRYPTPGNAAMAVPAPGRGNGIIPASNLLSSNAVQLVTFDRDNDVPLDYTGSTVSQNQMVCYEIELLSLVLPNKPLENEIGGLIAFYPYLYVQLTNETAPSGGTPGIIYSNNPHAHSALFRVAIDDTPTPAISQFIKVDGDGAVQTVKFKPNDNLHFKVFLQNGLLFATQTNDTVPPLPPDPFVQISAQFSIRRLT